MGLCFRGLTQFDATIALVQGAYGSEKLKNRHIGPPLEWSRLTYDSRAQKMRTAVNQAIDNFSENSIQNNQNYICRLIEEEKILFISGAIPDSLSVSKAREFVGQPHLRDHVLHDFLSDFSGGPVHVIACHKGCTESQARTMLGFPDATIIKAPFGIYIADTIQSIQIVLIANCSDQSSTKLGVQRFIQWLDESGQKSDLLKYASKRKKIIDALAS